MEQLTGSGCRGTGKFAQQVLVMHGPRLWLAIVTLWANSIRVGIKYNTVFYCSLHLLGQPGLRLDASDY